MAANSIDFSAFDDDLGPEQMAAALEDKRKELAKFKKQMSSKDDQVSRVKKKQEEAVALALQKKEDDKKRVAELKLKRSGIDSNDVDSTTDAEEAYRAFSVLDIDSSGRISLRELQRYLGGDADYFYDMAFDEEDAGMLFACDTPGVVHIQKIEEHSPARMNKECAEGLKLLSFNEKPYTVEHLPGFSTWPDVKKREETMRFFEHLIKDAKAKGEGFKYKFLEPKYIFSEYNNVIDLELEKGGGCKTAVIPPGAYNHHEDVLLALQTNIQKADPGFGKFKVSIDRDTLTYTFDNNGVDFKFLWRSGPHHNESAGPTLGFVTGDTEFDDVHHGGNRTLDLNLMLNAVQVRILTHELVKEIDSSANMTIEFHEFMTLYAMYFADEKRREILIERVVERFLGPEQKAQRAALLAEKKKLKKRLKDQLKVRDKQRAIARAQAEKRKGMKRDQDGVHRQHHQHEIDPDFVPPPPPEKPPPKEKTPEEIAKDKAREGEKEKKRKQMDEMKAKEQRLKEEVDKQKLEATKTKEWQLKQHKLQLSMLGLESLVETTTTQEYHPSCVGFIMKKMPKMDPSLISPMYFGVQNMKMGEAKAAALKLGQNYKEFKKQKHSKIEEKMGAFVVETSTPPIAAGQVRQRYKEWGEAYDNQEIVNPAMFGQMLVPTQEFNPAVLSPVFFGYMLFKKPVFLDETAGAVAKDKSKDVIVVEKECHICYSRKAGCPNCWNFPGDFQLADYAYEGPKKEGAKQNDTDSEDEDDDEKKPEIHTNLTTMSAVRLYRQVNQSIITIYVKTVPCGAIVRMKCERSWTVGDLYEIFRSSSMYGSTRDCFLFLPTETGVFSLDNEDLPETDTTNAVTTGRVPLSRYNMTKNGSIITLLHFQFFSGLTTSINIKSYLDQNLNLLKMPITTVSPFVDGIPKQMPGTDAVQMQLVNLIKKTIVTDTRIRTEDLNADNAEIATRIKFKVDEEKEKLLVIRKEKAEELKVMREERRAKEREERDEGHETMFQEVLKNEKIQEEKEIKEAEEKAAAEAKKKKGIFGGLGLGKGLLAKGLGKMSPVELSLPGIGGLKSRSPSPPQDRTGLSPPLSDKDAATAPKQISGLAAMATSMTSALTMPKIKVPALKSSVFGRPTSKEGGDRPTSKEGGAPPIAAQASSKSA